MNKFLEQKKRFKDADYMKLALEVAQQAKSNGDLPIAAVLVWGGGKQLVEHDTRYTEQNLLGYALLNLINKASTTFSRRRISEAVVYCTLEPNLLCALALEAVGIKEVIFGAYDDRDGYLSANVLKEGVELDLSALGGVLGEQCCRSLPMSMQEHVRYE